MPSQLEHELNKLRGEVSSTGKVYTSSIAALQDALTAAETAIEALDTDNDTLQTRVNKAISAARSALSNANSSLKTAGGDITGVVNFQDDIKVGEIITTLVTGTPVRDSNKNIRAWLAALAGSDIEVNTIGERTGATGVTIDTVLLKDGNVDGRDVSVDGTKLDTIDSGADVTANAGAVMYLSCHFDKDDLNTGNAIEFGSIPTHAYVIDVQIDVTVAFNASGTDVVEIGYTGDINAYGQEQNIETTGIKNPTVGVAIGYNASAVTASLRPRAGITTDATTGNATVILKYVKTGAP